LYYEHFTSLNLQLQEHFLQSFSEFTVSSKAGRQQFVSKHLKLPMTSSHQGISLATERNNKQALQ
jgi:hypothetical protein